MRGLSAAYHRQVLLQTDQTDQEPEAAVFLPGPARAPYRNRDLWRHRLARWVSAAASVATYLLLPVVAYQLTGSSLWTAAVAAVGCLPHLATRLVMSAIPAKLDRLRLIFAADLANAAVLASLPITFAMDALTAPHVLVAAFVVQALLVCHDAGYASIAPYRPGRAHPGTPLLSGGSVGLAAAVFAGGLLMLTAVPPLLTVDGVSIVVSALLVRAIAAPAEVVMAPLIRYPDGPGLHRRITLLWGRRNDLWYALISAVHAVAGGAFIGQFVPWLNQDLGVRPVRDLRLGLLLAASAGGAWLAALALPRVTSWLAPAGLLPPAAAERLVTAGVLAPAAADKLVARSALRRMITRLGEQRVTLVFLPVSGLLLLASAFAPHWIVAVVLLAAWGTAFMMVVLDVRAAGGGLRMLAFGLGWPAGALLGGLVAAVAGPRLGIASGVVPAVVVAAIGWWLSLHTAGRPGPAADPAGSLPGVHVPG